MVQWGEGKVHHHDDKKMRPADNGGRSVDPSILEPLALPLARAVLVTGLSRSAIYRAAAAGQLTLLKAGRTTLLEMNSARAFLAGLPRAAVGWRPGHDPNETARARTVRTSGGDLGADCKGPMGSGAQPSELAHG